MQEPITSASAALSVPPLLFIFCALSSMGFILSTLRWLYRTHNNFPAQTFAHKVWTDQIYILLGGTLFSFIRGLYEQFFGEGEINLMSEVIILGGIAIAFALHAHIQKSSIHRAILRKILYTLALSFACVIGWIITFIMGILAAQVTSVFAPQTVDPIFSGVIVGGLWWLIPLSLLYRRMKNRHLENPAYDHVRLHHFLWPLALACLVLLMPLSLQDFMASGKWQEIKNARPLKII